MMEMKKFPWVYVEVVARGQGRRRMRTEPLQANAPCHRLLVACPAEMIHEVSLVDRRLFAAAGEV